MAGRDRADSSAMKGLLVRQLADISDTLARASARRDAEVQRRLTPQLQLDVTPKYIPPSTNPSFTSDAEATIGSKSGRSVALAGSCSKPNLQNFGQPYLNLPQTTRIMDDSSPTASLRGGYVSNEEDPRTMIAQFEKADTTTSALKEDDDDIESMLQQLERLKATHSHFSNDDSKGTAPRLDTIGESEEVTLLMGLKCASDDDEDDDPTRLLAELASSSLLGPRILQEEMDDVDPEQLLTEIKIGTSIAKLDTAHDVDGELPEMLTNFKAREQLFHDCDSMKTPTVLERTSPTVYQSSSGTEEENIGALYNRLMGLRSCSPDSVPYIFERQSGVVSDVSTMTKPHKDIIPYIVALQLEMAGTHWEAALGWTKYLFSTGLDGHQARHKKDEILAQADKDMTEIIQQVLRDEEHYLGTEDRNKIPRRLIVSNLAAGAREEDLKEFFYSLRYMIQGIKVLPIRDPNKGTQVAHVDMFTRQDAILASFTVGSIFGLIPILELAEKQGN